jgi:hypothetical protein
MRILVAIFVVAWDKRYRFGRRGLVLQIVKFIEGIC